VVNEKPPLHISFTTSHCMSCLPEFFPEFLARLSCRPAVMRYHHRCTQVKEVPILGEDFFTEYPTVIGGSI